MTLFTSILFLALAAIACASGPYDDKLAFKTSRHASLRAGSVKLEVSTQEGYTSRKDVPSHTGGSLDKASSGYKGFESSQESLIGVALWSRILRVLAKIRRMDLHRMVEEDVKVLANTFLPEPRPRLAILWGSSSLVVVVVTLWLAAYLSYIYQHDRNERFDHWKDNPKTPSLDQQDEDGELPDFIIVFHHPGRHRKDDDMSVASSTLKKCIVYDDPHRNTDNLKHSGSRMFKQTQWPAHEAREASGRRRSSLSHLKSFIEKLDEEDGPEQVSLGAVRKSLLQFIFSRFPRDGFHLNSFSSIDGEELFVGVSIKDVKSLRQLLINDRMRLQIQHWVVNDMLDIGQPQDEPESSPPFVPYDVGLAKRIGGPGCTDLKFYRAFHGAKGHGSIIGAKDRISIVRRRLECFLDIDASMHFGLLKDFYPVHGEHYITDLDAIWSTWTMLKDFSFVQPVSLLNRYFGPGYALQFAWNGLYCKMLLALLPVAVLFEAVHHVENIVGFKFGLTFLCFSTILVIWSRMAHNLFEREERYFKILWDVNLDSEETRRCRPDFIGERVESPVDKYRSSFEYPRQKQLLRRAVSWICTFILCSFVQVTVYIWINVFEGHMDYVASGCLAVMINVIQLCYRPFVNYMTIMENHKFHDSFIRSYTSKLLVFACFNQYSVFFYIAIKMPWTRQGCPNHDCIGLLRYQLCMTFGSLCALSIGLALSKYVKVQVLLWWQASSFRERLGGSRGVLDRTFLEEQSKYENNRYQQQAQAKVQLIIPLGFVLIFGSVAPRIVPLCLLTFSIQLRAGAFMTTRCMRRPYPNLDGLSWSMVVQCMMTCGMCFSGFLWVAYGALFQQSQLITKLSSFIVYLFCMQCLWTVTDQLCSQTSQEEKLLKARRAYALHELHDRQTGEDHNDFMRGSAQQTTFYEEVANDMDPHEELTNDMDAHAKAILAGEWDRVGGFTPRSSPRSSLRTTPHDTPRTAPQM